MFAGYHLQTVSEINTTIRWLYSAACLTARTDSPVIINSNYLTSIIVFRPPYSGLSIFIQRSWQQSLRQLAQYPSFYQAFRGTTGFLGTHFEPYCRRTFHSTYNNKPFICCDTTHVLLAFTDIYEKFIVSIFRLVYTYSIYQSSRRYIP